MEDTKSPLRDTDPLIRALNTIIYGVIVHYTTMLLIRQENDAPESCDLRDTAKFLPVLLFHEYWVYLQHSNVLGNPLCQRLDRQFGIALLRSNQHWSIAGTLSAYWCREMISLFLCLPFLCTSYTRYLVLYSLIYHTIKSRGIRKDAIQRHSTTFGIMRQVIDKFYHHSATESVVTIVRLMLQGTDTFIHALVIKDLIRSRHIGLGSVDFLHTLFIVWVFHAAMNQFFLCSTATLMVQTWHALSGKPERRSSETTIEASVCELTDDETESESENDSSAEGQDDGDKFIVRSLLRKGRVSEDLKGKQGAASSAVDTAIRIETTLATIASVYTFGFADSPLQILLLSPELLQIEKLQQVVVTSLPYAWLLMTSILAALVMLLPSTKRMPKNEGEKAIEKSRQRYLVNLLDVLVIVVGAYWADLSFEAKIGAHLLGAGITAKSFLKASRWHAPRIFWQIISALEMGMKIAVGRWLSPSQEDAAVIGAIITIVCCAYGVLRRSGSHYEREETSKNVADVAFLGHPAELHDCWALWLLPYSLSDRWQRPWWVVPLWPLHYLVGYYTCNWRPKLFGDSASFFCCDDVMYGHVRMQTWTSCHFGRHFFTAKGVVKRNIEAAARHAEKSGLKVLTLGALNKAEGINRGGAAVALALGPHRKLSLIHGNHLTAAAVVETTRQCFGEGAKVFLTGASSKIGWAVAQALKDRYNFEVLCHSTDAARRKCFEESGFGAASTLEEGMAFTNLWIVGKYDDAVAETIPQGSTALVFAVPNPLHGRRKDVRVEEAGNLHVDLSRFDRPRRFTNKLASHEIFACHAAGVVAAHRLKQGLSGPNGRIDEIGPVDPNTMDSWLEDAKQLGFTVPSVQPVDNDTTYPHDMARFLAKGTPPVVVVGAGPSGLAVAASLRIKGIQSIILEEQTADDSFGSWDKHFTKLEVTTSKKFCALPGYSMSNKQFLGNYVTASQYRKYLCMYADRFQLDIRRGHRVKDIVRGNETASWIVQCEDDMIESLPASAVVVATGRHRVPRTDTDDGLREKLREKGIEAVHSTEMRCPKTWSRATEAAGNGKLCIVGFGNSAADIAAAILQTAQDEEGKKCIHVATRTVPPIFPRQKGIFRIDSIGRYVRLLPTIFQEVVTSVLWRHIPESSTCNDAFPPALPRWTKLAGRVPVIDKSGEIARALENGKLVGHGPVGEVSIHGTPFANDSCVHFMDGPNATNRLPVPIDFVILATGYKKECIVTREDRLNGLFLCGFGNDKFLPLRSIGEDAKAIASEIEMNTHSSYSQ